MKVKANKATAWLTAAGASAASMAFAFPVSAFAAEEKTGIAVILPDPIEFIPMLIAFLILAIVLGKFGWPKFEGMLEKREKTIADALEQSRRPVRRASAYSKSTSSSWPTPSLRLLRSLLRQSRPAKTRVHSLPSRRRTSPLP